MYPVGKIVGLFPVAWLNDRYGRKFPIFLGLFLLIATAIFQAASQSIGMFLASRFLVGVATVFVAQPSPILITELAFPLHRGKMTAMYNTSYYLGAILAAWATYGTFRLQSTWSWRIPSGLQAGYPIIQMLFIYWLPESPRYVGIYLNTRHCEHVLTASPKMAGFKRTYRRSTRHSHKVSCWWRHRVSTGGL